MAWKRPQRPRWVLPTSCDDAEPSFDEDAVLAARGRGHKVPGSPSADDMPKFMTIRLASGRANATCRRLRY